MTAGTVVVGGGISGIACASAMSEAGLAVELRERGHRLGGRLASRTLRDTGTAYDGRVVDIGASYFTASDPGFAAAAASLKARGIVHEWTDRFHVAGPGGIEAVSAGPMRYAAAGGLCSVVADLARDLPRVTCRSPVGRVDSSSGAVLVDGFPAAAVALCMPGPQAARILAGLPAEVAPWEAVLAVTCVFDRSHWIDLDGVFVNDDAIITWIADDGSRRGDGAPVLVAHASPALSARHLDDPTAVIALVIAAVQRVLGFSAHPAWVEVHRWTYARPRAATDASFWLADDANVGLAGDAFAGGPRVEAAWLSGRRLGAELAARLRQ